MRVLPAKRLPFYAVGLSKDPGAVAPSISGRGEGGPEAGKPVESLGSSALMSPPLLCTVNQVPSSPQWKTEGSLSGGGSTEANRGALAWRSQALLKERLRYQEKGSLNDQVHTEC